MEFDEPLVKAPAPASKAPPKTPNYMLYTGNTKTGCRGHCIFGSKPLMAVFSLIFFNLPAIINLARTLPNYKDKEMIIYLAPIMGVLIVITNVLSFMTTFSNPGIVGKLQNSLRMRTVSNLAETREMDHYDLVVRGPYLTKLKFCITCFIYRPLRTVHCHYCGNCVFGFDHHCKWLGTCIGALNYKKFLWFLIFLNILEICNFILAVSHIILVAMDEPGRTFGEALAHAFKNYPSMVVIWLLSMLVLFFSLKLLIFHLKLICKN